MELSSLLLLSPLLFFLLSGRPRPLESKVIRIQSDHPLAFSPPVAAMERSKVICSIQVRGRDVGLSSKVSLTLPVLVVLALEPPFSSSYLMLLFTTLSLLQIDEMAVIFWRWICMVPSMCFFPRLSWVSCMHWRCFRCAHSTEATDCVSGLDTLFYKGLAGPHYLLEKNI